MRPERYFDVHQALTPAIFRPHRTMSSTIAVYRAPTTDAEHKTVQVLILERMASGSLRHRRNRAAYAGELQF